MKIILGLVMLLIAFEPAFSGRILNKLNKELKKMGLQKLQNLFADVQTLETMGSGSVWFDAVRTSNFEASSFTTITYTNVTESSNSGLDIGTGMFTAPMAGTYQFIIQVTKFADVRGDVRIQLDGTTVSYILDRDTPNRATITGTAIIEMQPGQKAWADTNFKLFSSSDGEIQFTGVLITPK